MKRIIICGYLGKLGSKCYEALRKDNRFEVVALVDINTIPLSAVLVTTHCEIVLDFTSAGSCYEHALIALAHGCHFLSGTTGLKEEELREIDTQAKIAKKQVLICPNFTQGYATIRSMMKQLEPDFPTLQIEEQHHITKRDSPSGTALALQSLWPNNSKPIIAKRVEHRQAYHRLEFSNECEIIEITHRVLSYEAYVKGIIRALTQPTTWIGLKTESL